MSDTRNDAGTATSGGAVPAPAIFPTGWAVQAQLMPGDGGPTAQFGGSAGISGSAVAVGAQGMNHGAGAFYVFEADGSGWTQAFEQGGTWPQALGGQVAIQGGTALAGALGAGAGAVYVFTNDGEGWGQTAVLQADEGLFGSAVAVDGATAVVGAALGNNYLGAAYVYVGQGSEWTLQGTLTADTQPYSYFGGRVAVDGDWVAVALGQGGGAVWMYQRSGGAWTLRQTISGPGGFGLGGVALNGTLLVVGNQFDATNGQNAGAASFYVWDGTEWGLAQVIHGEAAGDFYGVSVAAAGRVTAVGAMQAGGGAGAVYVYGTDGATVVPAPPNAGGSFGFAVSTDGARVLASASGENTSGRVFVIAPTGG